MPHSGTGQLRRIQPLLAAHDHDLHQSVRQLHRQLDGCGQPALDTRLHQQAIDHQFDGVVLALVEFDFLVGNVTQLAVNAGTRVALLRQLVELLLELAFTSANDGRQDHHPIFGLQLHHLLHDLVGRLPRNLAARIAGNAERLPTNTAGAGSRRFR